MSGARRRKGGHGAEFHLDERWMTSYADMITVLMCLFIVLYAMSTVDSHKFDVLKNSLASGFGVTKTEKIDQSDSIVPKEFVKPNGAGFSATTLTSDQASKLVKQHLITASQAQSSETLAAKLEAALKQAGVSSDAEVRIDARGVTIGLIGSSTYFGGNDATLQPAGVRVLSAIGPVLKPEQKVVTIEGHADPHGSAGAFGNDWALAAARASTVLTWLVDRGDVAPARISAISYGSAQPVTTARGEEARNRRVDVVVHEPSTAAVTSRGAATSSPTAASAPHPSNAGVDTASG